jgi:AcrR family transcriptional regulator
MPDMKHAPIAAAQRRRRKEDRPPEIVRAALAEFAEKGFAATKLDDVARRAGISKGTIYLYFADKDALFEAVVRETIGPVLDRVQHLSEAPPSSMEALVRAIVATVYRELVDTERRQIMRMMIAEAGRFPQLAEFYYRETVARGKAVLAAALARGVASGEFRDGPAARQPEVVLGPAIMAAVWKMLFDRLDPLDVDRFMAAHLDLVLNGLKAAKAGIGDSGTSSGPPAPDARSSRRRPG